MDEELLLKNRFSELENRSFSRGCYAYSDFLTLAQQNILNCSIPKNRFTLYGGYQSAERKIACFGSEEICGYEDVPPVECIEIKPLQQKFADILSHRDFLGALMGLGIKREVLGDIIIHNNTGYLFCLQSVSQYIIDSFIQVKHTSVTCSRVDSPPVECVALPEDTELVVASMRADAVISAVYKLSRNESSKIFEQKTVFINSTLCENSSKPLSEGDIVSIRGKGRFLFSGQKLITKKGKNRIVVKIFR